MDATFVTVRRTAARRPGATAASNGSFESRRRQVTTPDSPLASMVRVLAGKAEQALMRLSADFFAAMVALVFIAVFGMCGGFTLLLGNSDGIGEKPGLDLTHVNLTAQDADGMRVLMINGIVENNGENRLELPGIQAHLVSDGSIVASAFIDPPVAGIEGGQSHGFAARIPHPGGKNPELKLSFASPDASGR